MLQGFADLVVGGLGEVLIELPDGSEHVRRVGADEFVDFGAEQIEGFKWRDRDGDDDARRLLLTNGADGCQHGVTGGKAVVDEDDGLSGDDKWRPVASVGALAAEKLLVLASDGVVDGFLGDVQRGDGILVQDDEAADGDGSHGELGLAGCAELADGEDVERERQGAGQRGGDGYASTGEGEKQCLRLAAVAGELVGENFPGVLAVAKHEMLDAASACASKGGGQAGGAPAVSR